MQGEPFVGRAGELLTKIIVAMGFKREDVYIANVLKCRPPENRTPLPDEVTNCLPYLLSQIELIKPKLIVALGATAVRALLDVQLGITKMRGHWYTFRDIPIMPTFHPAYLLRNPPGEERSLGGHEGGAGEARARSAENAVKDHAFVRDYNKAIPVSSDG